MSRAMPEPALRGRRRECELLRQVLADARKGESRVLVLRGDPGSGKTALLRYVSGLLGEWHRLVAVGVESEMELAYSGLHQLCFPVLDRLDRLPRPQRDALAVVFGLSSGPPPDRFLVALATLTLLDEVAKDEPLACVVDDAQWLDQASAQVLGFVARRLLAEPIALVCAARTGVGDAVLPGAPALAVAGLGVADSRALLMANVTGRIDPEVAAQIVAESHGNPLALLELPRTWTGHDLAGGYGLPDSRPAASRVEQSYAQRLASLPQDTQQLLLIAAAEPLGHPRLLGAAAAALGVDLAAAAPAVAAGLLRLDARVEFAHPLVRSATYRAALPDQRQRVHRALAEATDIGTDPDRRAWHRSRATKAANEDVAAELERSAGRAQSRGGFAAAGAFLSRATELTPDPSMRSRRALGAAAANLQAGEFETARRMLTLATDEVADDLQLAQIDLVRAQLAFASSRGTEAPPLLLAAAQRLQPFDVRLARETYLDAFTAALFGARLNETVGMTEIAAAARAAAGQAGPEPTPADLLLNGLIALADDHATAVPPCRAAVRRMASGWTPSPSRLRRLWQGCVVAIEIWDDESAYVLSQRHVEIARRTGALSEVALALSSQTPVLVFCGELAVAAAAVAETQSVEEMTGIAAAPYGALIVAAWQGRAEHAARLIASTRQEATARGEGIGVAICAYTQAVLANGGGRYHEAISAARDAADHREVVVENWALPELIEAASRAGEPGLARASLTRLAEKTQACRTDWALGVEARSRALLSAGARAEDRYRASIDHLARTRMRGDLARAHLLYGEWLRRANRRVDARRELDSAFELFTAMDMAGFAERARHELLATGATVRKRGFEESTELTAQELQIARLATQGQTNSEIGAQLFISSRTVEWHLRKIYSKLGISSRRYLHTALPD
ncbi:AAA family ATPase [Actinoplanes sp. KI2]|uniref:helix-turn-helix transcriptional regulator n=1 Tax=Actinoplanes sp. KI2 TaxID=2983315 RepID=UPI0021D590CF|nr:AAA family ATPase [Actinoplanes sp. KI2]MCU7730085.1 AAA family ATPase [Actinoplanes sp. KI2]